MPENLDEWSCLGCWAVMAGPKGEALGECLRCHGTDVIRRQPGTKLFECMDCGQRGQVVADPVAYCPGCGGGPLIHVSQSMGGNGGDASLQ